MNNIKTIPRVVLTGHTDQGKSTITRDTIANNVSEDIPGLVISDIWATNTMPVDLNQELLIPNTLLPITPKNGSYFRYVEIPPDSKLKSNGLAIDQDKPHPLMHTTQTLDYIIILSGELYLITEEQETLLKAGDIVIQRGTHHAWSNRSKWPCIQLAILLDAKML